MSDILHLLASDPNVSRDFRAMLSDKPESEDEEEDGEPTFWEKCGHGLAGYCGACAADDHAIEAEYEDRSLGL